MDDFEPMPELPEQGEFGKAPYNGKLVYVLVDGAPLTASYVPSYGTMDRVFVTDDEMLIPAESVEAWKAINLSQEPGGY